VAADEYREPSILTRCTRIHSANRATSVFHLKNFDFDVDCIRLNLDALLANSQAGYIG
jgi:hypothetical protein